MNISFDPEIIRVSMSLWRDSLSNAIPMATEFQLHFITERPHILRNFEASASAWLMLLRRAEPAPAEKEAHDLLIGDIEAFQRWVKGELQALRTMEVQAQVEAGLDELIGEHPELVQRLAGQLWKKPGSS